MHVFCCWPYDVKLHTLCSLTDMKFSENAPARLLSLHASQNWPTLERCSSGGFGNFVRGEVGGGGAEDDVSTPSPFIANAHNSYAFYTRNCDLKKLLRPVEGSGCPNAKSTFQSVIS